MIFEADPTNVDDQVSMISRPGLSYLGNAGGGFIAGLIRRENANDDVFGVSGEFYFAVSSSGAVSVGSGGISGSSRVRMATDGANTMIVRSGTLYCKPGSGPLDVVALPDTSQASDVVYLAGRFWVSIKSTGRVYFTNPGETTIDPLNYFTAESSPDAIQGLGVDDDQLMILGRSSIEWWTPTGDPDLPAQRVVGRHSPAGLASVFSLATTDAGLAWVGDDGIIYRSGGIPTPISQPDIAEAIARGRLIANDNDPATTLNGWSFTLEQHVYYVLDVPGEGTLAYDFTTGQWSDFGTNGKSLFMAGCGAKLAKGKWITGGSFDSKIRQITPTALTDDGTPLVREFFGLTRSRTTLRFSNVFTECSVGGAGLAYPSDDPKLAMRYSDNEGKTWSEWQYASLGRQGQYNRKPTFKNPTKMRFGTRIWCWRMSDPVPFTVHTAGYNEKLT
ncbi:hypothetical protein CSW62_06690 [Caulobacter sp. FWC2]|nr:hypothetical protein CSW62_06690 [Caulobacter sp. FWC2]